MSNLIWCRVTPQPGLGVRDFVLDVCTVIGDANDSSRVTTADYSCVKAALGQRGNVRADLNGSDRVTTADFSVVKPYLGDRSPTKPGP